MHRHRYVLTVLLAALLMAAMATNAFADFTIGPGETYTLAPNETFIVDANLTIDATGTLDASAANTTIILTGNWTNNGTFTPGTDSTVTFQGAGASTITGATTFNNLTCATPSKNLTFEAGVTQTISGTLTLNGQALGTKIVLRSSVTDTRFTLNVTAGAQTVNYVDVKDSQASGNDIIAGNSLNSGNNDDAEASPHWVFGAASLDMRKTVTDDNAGTLLAGENITYTITLNNDGGSSANNTVITDAIPGNTTYVANSTTLGGSPVADANGTSPLVSGLTVGTLNPAATATVTFKVTVNSNVVSGAVISSQASATADGLSNPELSDEPNTDSDGNGDATNEDDPTVIVVGSAAVTNAVKTVTDVNGGSVEIGDTLHYTIVINNIGNVAATSVVFTDLDGGAGENLANATYTAGTIELNDAARTDANDTDEADFGFTTANTITVSVGTIAVGSSAKIEFDVTVDAATSDGTVISNQGTVSSGNSPAELTDEDGNGLNGNQATTCTVGLKPNLTLIKGFTDLNGGWLEAGDTILYTLTFSNTGAAIANGVVITDTPDSDTTYTAGTITLAGVSKTDAGGDDEADYNVTTANTITVDAGNVAAGEIVTVTYEVTVDAVSLGTEITNSAQADDTDGTTPAATDSVTIDVGGNVGVAGITGRLYLDRDQDDTYTAGEELAGWTVEFEDSFGNTYQGTTDAQGNYVLQGIPTPADYTARFYNADGMQFGGDLVIGTVNSGDFEIDFDLPIDPSGYVYDSVTGQIVAGAQVALYESGVLVPAGDLFGTPNPQTVDALGFYQFLFLNSTIPPGKTFEIRVTPPAGYILSVNYPPVVNDVTAGLLTIAAGQVDASDGVIVVSGNVDDKTAPPFNVTGPNGALYRYAWQIVYGAGEFGEVFQLNVPLDPLTNASFRVTKEANKKEVSVGDIVTYTVTIENLSSVNDVSDIYLEDKIPAGFKYLSGKAILDGAPISNPTGTRPITFDIGTITGGQTRTLKYQLIVGSGVTFGKYENACFAKLANGMVISNTATETVKVVPDPLFDLGTTIGKVFHDRNENGIQDPPETVNGRRITEEPIPGAVIVTEEGTVITTDQNGQYHLAGIVPGRHLFRLDERTLPDGAYLTTDKVVIVDVTPGILRKVNFGVKLPTAADAKAMPFTIVQDRGTPQPRLNVSLFNDELIVEDGRLEERAEFRIFTNYHLFIKDWKLDVLDKDTKRVVAAFGGPGSTMFEPIYLDPVMHKSLRMKADRDYVYSLTVTGAGGKKDVTKEREFGIRNAEFGIDKKEKAEAHRRWMERESGINNLEKQTIRVEGETIQLSAISRQLSAIKIVKAGKVQAEIPVIESQGLRAKDLLKSSAFAEAATDKQSRMEVILPGGEYEIQTRRSEDGGQTAEDERRRTEDGRQVIFRPGSGQALRPGSGQAGSETYSKHIEVGDDYLFFVAMGDAKMGHTFNQGNIEPVEHDDKFQEGFWAEGKLAYYLKGKIKGKYLITSSFDSEREKKELFKNLDPDKYYPIYGDESSIDYSATDTQGMLYLLIEWDKSSAIWGNYNTAFTDTEFAQFSRSLYGGKVHLETVAATRFGEPNAKLVLFKASAQQKAAHNEFTGTGGSLYYLKHKDVIEGSDKVRIEVRDKITGLVLAEDDMKEEVDYEIDYSNGRITFWRPISQISESNSIISTHLLDGNPVYVVVDYEYEVKDEYDEGTVGGRVQKSITDYVSVGGTYVKEEQAENDYELKGADATIHLGKDIQITAEYAESESEATGSFISTDGGLSFTELPTDQHAKGKAYGVKGDARLFGDKLGLSAYYKKIEKGFSTSGTSSQQGKELTGFGATYDPTEKTSLTASHDIQELLDDGNPQTQLQVGATKTETTSAQITHDMATDKLKLTAEIRHQEVTERKEEFDSETNTEEDVLAVKADYKLTDNIDVFLRQQATLKGEDNDQTTAGMEVEVFDWLSLRGAETVGTKGNATSVGATAGVKDSFTLSADYTKANYKTGETGDAASLSASARIDEKTEVHGTYALTDGTEAPTDSLISDSQLTGSTGNGKTHSLALGSKKKLNDIWGLTGDATFASSRDTRTYGATTGLVREKDGRSLEGTFTRQHSESSNESSNSNIFGLSGDINDRWAAFGTFEKGAVRYHDGTDASRYAGSLGFGFVDRDEDTDDIRLKASSKLELRFDNGVEDKRQYLLYNAIEGKVTPNTTLFAKANLSQTKNTTTDTTEAQYKELSLGAAYRPIDVDWLNLLAKYTYLEDDAPASQSDINDIEAEKAHVLAGEAVIDLSDKWQLSEKLAYKMGEEKVTGFDFTETSTWLWINRLGYRINQDWEVAGEYRLLAQKQAEDQKHGALFEASRNIGDYFQIGVGYNFTEFNDDLTHLDYTSHGPYIRITAMFFDRSAKEKKRAAKRIKERQKEQAEKFLKDEGAGTLDKHKFLEIDKLKPVPKDKQKIGIKVLDLEDEGEDTPVKHKFLEIDKIKPVPKDKQKIGIKVLSGDGDINSARAMANELENLGYKVAHIEMALQPNFMQNTVYYAPNFQNEAKRLANSLADKPALKPLRLPSMFDIIVVTGKKPAETDKATSLSGDKKKIYMYIKVLSGDGDINSARAMANELKNLGYKVDHIEMAPRSSSTQNIVFYALNFQNEARRLADSLSGKPVLKPISWPSIFDIIVVTGKKPD